MNVRDFEIVLRSIEKSLRDGIHVKTDNIEYFVTKPY
jgi:hypothetical protein